MEWIINAIMEAETVFLTHPNNGYIYATSGVKFRYIDGLIQVGGEIKAPMKLPDDGFVVQVWSKNSYIDFFGFDIDILGDRGAYFFNANSVPGMSKAVFHSDDNDPIMKSISISL